MGRARISDRDFLEEYVSFAVWQPAFFSSWLLNQIGHDGGFSQSASLQIYKEYIISLETLCKWFFAISEWEPGAVSLIKKFKSVDIKEHPKAQWSTSKALELLKGSQNSDILTQFKQPTSLDLRKRGWPQEYLDDYDESALRLVETMRDTLTSRTALEGNLVRGYNSIKHGQVLVRNYPGMENEGRGSALITNVTEDSPTSSFFDAIWLPSAPESLREIVDGTITACSLVAQLLAFFPWIHFTRLNWRKYSNSGDNAVGAIKKIWQQLQPMMVPTVLE